MANRILSFTGLLLISIFIFSEVAAHSPPGRCATFYTEKNKKGSKIQICNGDPIEKCNFGGEFVNAVSSVYVPYGYNVRLFRQANKKGEWMDIRAGTWNAPDDWDNCIASVSVVNFGLCSTFYKESDQQGESKLICDGTILPAGWNDAVSSIDVVYNHNMRIYKAPQKGLPAEWLDIRGKWTAPADWDKKVYRFAFKHWAICFWIYKEAKLKGERFYVCDNIDTMPVGWDGAIASLRVPAKSAITFFSEPSYQGDSITIQPGVWNCPAEWNGKIRSLKYIKYFHS